MGRPGVEKGVPIIGVDYGYLWSRAPEASDAPYDEVAGEDPPDGVRTSSPVLSGRCSVDRWIFGHLCKTKGDNERNRAVLAKELQAGGYSRVVVRSDSELALLAHVKAARAMTMVSDVPLESVHEQVSKEQSPRNGSADGAVKEQLGGDVVRARLQDPQGVVRTAEQAQLQPREELEAALDSICKHVKELGALHVAGIRCRGDFVARAFGEIGECNQRAPRCGCGLAVWLGLGFGSWSTGVLEDVTCRTSKDEREARIQGIKHLNFCCAVYRWQNRAWSTLSP